MKSEIDFEVLESVFEGLINGQQRCQWQDLLNRLEINNVEEFNQRIRSFEELKHIVEISCILMGISIQWFREYYIFCLDIKQQGLTIRSY